VVEEEAVVGVVEEKLATEGKRKQVLAEAKVVVEDDAGGVVVVAPVRLVEDKELDLRNKLIVFACERAVGLLCVASLTSLLPTAVDQLSSRAA